LCLDSTYLCYSYDKHSLLHTYLEVTLVRINTVLKSECVTEWYVCVTLWYSGPIWRCMLVKCKNVKSKYSRVSFCNGSFYDDSLVQPLSCRTEHSRLVVYHCCNSSVLSLLSALLALFWCACVSSFFYFSAVLLSLLWFFHPWHPSKRQKRKQIKTGDITFFLDVFWSMAWAFFNKIKSDLIDIFFYYLCYFPCTWFIKLKLYVIK